MATKEFQRDTGLPWSWWLLSFSCTAQPLTTHMCHNVKFDLTLTHQLTFIILKGALIKAPIIHYPDPSKHYIVYTDASDDACKAQPLQEHDGQKLPVAFLIHTFTHSTQMEHPKRRSLRDILCHKQVELLSPRI